MDVKNGAPALDLSFLDAPTPIRSDDDRAEAKEAVAAKADPGMGPGLDFSFLDAPEQETPAYQSALDLEISPAMALEMQQGLTPDLVAEQVRLAKATGMAPEIVAQDMDAAKRMVQLSGIYDAAEANPEMLEWYKDAYGASVSGDDVSVLDKITGAFKSGVSALSQWRTNLSQDYDYGIRQQRLSLRAYDAISNRALLPELLKEEEALGKSVRKTSGKVDQYLWQPFGRTGLPFLVEGTKQAGTGAMIGAVTAIVAGQMGPQALVPEELVTVPAASVAAAAMAVSPWMARMEGGGAFLEYVKMKDANGNPVDPDVAAFTAVLTGMANAGLELTGAAAISKAYAPIFNAFRDRAFKSALRNPSYVGAARRFLKDYGKALATETTTEMAQELVTILGGRAVQNVNAVMQGTEPGEPQWYEGVLPRLGETALETVGAFGPILLPGPGVRLSANLKSAQRGQSNAEMMEGAIDLAAESKTRARDADAFEAFIRKVAPEEAKIQYIDAETLQTFYQLADEGGVVMPELEKLGIDDMAFEAAIQDGTVLPLDTAKFLAHVPLETQRALLPELRADPLAMTAKEAAQVDFAAQSRAIAEEYRPNTERAVRYAEEKRRITDELVKAGRPVEYAEAEADILVAKSFAWESAYGFDGIAELQRRRIVRGEDAAVSAAPTYNQAAMYKSKSATVEEFVAEAAKIDAQGNKPFFHMGETNRADGIGAGHQIQLGADQVRHVSGRHPDFTAWAEIPAVIETGTATPIGKNQTTGGETYAFVVDMGDTSRVVVAAPMGGRKGKRMVVLTAFDDTSRNVAAWIERNNTAFSQGDPNVADNSPGRQRGVIDNIDIDSAVVNDAAAVDGQEGGALRQDGEAQAVRGSVDVLPDADIIKFFQAQNVSTAMHEFSHVFLADMERAVADANAPEALRRDYELARQFVGAKEGQPLTREQHEKFARAGEAYMREGVSPSTELAGVFYRFRNWLTALYRHVRQLDVELNDEIRGVFDRLLATESQLAETRAINDMAESEAARIAALAAEGSLTAEEAATINRAYEEAYREALSAMDRVALRERNKRWREALAEARDIVGGEPVYAAVDIIRASDAPQDLRGISEAHIIENYSVETVKEIRRKFRGIINRTGGLGADVIAEDVGFATGDDLISALVDARPRGARINEMAEGIAAAEEAEAMPDKAALASEAYGEYLEKFNALLAKKIRGATYSPREYLARAAQDYISGMQIREATRYDIHQRTMRAQMQARMDAANAQDARAEMFALEKLRLAHEMVGKTLHVREQVAGTEKRIQRILKSKSINAQFHDQVLGLADRFGIGTARKPRSPEYMLPLSDILQGTVNDFGWSVSFPEWLTNGTYRQDYRDLTVSEFTQLENLLKHLEKRGREEFRESKASYAAQIENVVAEAVVPSRDMAPKPIYREGSLWRNATDGARRFFASLDSLQFLFRSFDGYQNTGPEGTRGPNERLIWDRIIDGSNARKVRIGSLQKGLEPHLLQLRRSARKWEKQYGKRLGRLFAEGVTVPRLLAERGRGWSADAVIAMALHMGTESNVARLRSGYSDLTPQTRDRLLDLLEEADWDAIQGVWDAFESQWADYDAAHYQVNGFHIAKIPAREFMPLGLERRGIYKKYRGGYCPAIYDPDLSRFVREFSENESIFAQTEVMYQAPNARSGATKARKNKAPGLPLLLSTSIISQHLRDVSTYITMAKPIRDADRITRSAAYESAFARVLGREAYDQIRPALKDIVLPEKTNMDMVDSLVEKARSYATPFYLAFNTRTMIMQFLSAPRGMHDIGVKSYARGLSYALTENPLQKVQWIMEVSPFMQERAFSRDRELSQMLQTFNINTRTLGVLGKDYTMSDLVNVGFTPMMITDWMTAYPIWLGKYQDALEQSGGDQQAAVLAADDAVRFSQSSANIEDLPAFLRSGKGIKRLFSLFGTDNIGRYGQRQRYHYRAWRAGQMTNMGYAWFNMVEAVLPAVALRVFFELMWRGQPLPDGDDDKRWFDFAGDVLNDIFLQGMPLVGNVFSTWRKPFDSPVGSVADRLVQGAKGVAKAAANSDDDDATEKAFKGLLEMGSILSRIPVSRIVRNIEKGDEQYRRGDATPFVYLVPEPKN